ncbi:MAG TPA: GDYXXLXY domain-containing protein [Bradyrhizobium sp.]|nr:GDYXXLXY domain-containing protein [Bradyrhizobium sp.]
MNTMDNVIARVPLLPRYILAALALCGLILATVVQRAAILRSGQEVRLEIVPVDPRALFRGDYVVLNYRIGTVDPPKDATTSFTRGQQVFVTLRPDASNKSKAVAISAERPAASGGDIVISGVVSSPSTCPLNETGVRDCKLGSNAVGVRYGLESYFVPEGEGKKIELIQRPLLEVVAAVAPSGQAAIKRLLIDGKPVYDEPPY